MGADSGDVGGMHEERRRVGDKLLFIVLVQCVIVLCEVCRFRYIVLTILSSINFRVRVEPASQSAQSVRRVSSDEHFAPP